MNRVVSQMKKYFRRTTNKQNKDHDEALNRDLDRFSMKLIKVVGVFGLIIGIVILVAFWYWVIKMLYKVG